MTSKLINLAKDCLLTGREQACTRITRLVGWLVVIVRHHAKNGWIHRKIAVDWALIIKSWPDPNSLLHRSTLVLFDFTCLQYPRIRKVDLTDKEKLSCTSLISDYISKKERESTFLFLPILFFFELMFSFSIFFWLLLSLINRTCYSLP